MAENAARVPGRSECAAAAIRRAWWSEEAVPPAGGESGGEAAPFSGNAIYITSPHYWRGIFDDFVIPFCVAD
jgi:hypothetical protein